MERTVVFRSVDLVIDGTTTTTTTTEAPTTKAPTTVAQTTTASTLQAKNTKPRTGQPLLTNTGTPGVTGRKKRSGKFLLSFGQRNHNFRIQCNLIKQGVVDHVIGHVGVK